MRKKTEVEGRGERGRERTTEEFRVTGGEAIGISLANNV